MTRNLGPYTILAASATEITLWHNVTRTSLAGDKRRRFPGTKEGWNTLQETTPVDVGSSGQQVGSTCTP
ncbi:MAG: hypothetical protein QOE48_5371 [Mycobacterium sp.]|jgi:hypothetical protein|nr:hypothetical protein [Mycobacterium sp.]